MSAAEGEKDERQKGQEGSACLPAFRQCLEWPQEDSGQTHLHMTKLERLERCAQHIALK